MHIDSCEFETVVDARLDTQSKNVLGRGACHQVNEGVGALVPTDHVVCDLAATCLVAIKWFEDQMDLQLGCLVATHRVTRWLVRDGLEPFRTARFISGEVARAEQVGRGHLNFNHVSLEEVVIRD